MANSKAIGNNYEREFSYKLSEWLTGEKDADVCWRDVGSGARHTSRKKQGKDTSRKADIVCTDLTYEEFFKVFYIDTKSYKEVNLMFINPANVKSNEIFQQWVKTIKECPKNMIPVMPVKIRDRKTPEFIILPMGLTFKGSNIVSYYIHYNQFEEYKFMLILQDDFFKNNNWEDLIKSNKINVI